MSIEGAWAGVVHSFDEGFDDVGGFWCGFQMAQPTRQFGSRGFPGMRDENSAGFTEFFDENCLTPFSPRSKLLDGSRLNNVAVAFVIMWLLYPNLAAG